MPLAVVHLVKYKHQPKVTEAIQFSEGLSVLVESESAVGLAAEFITAFRRHEKGGAR